jgi:hypothetical protein
MFFAVHLLPFCCRFFTTKTPQITITPFAPEEIKKETPKPFCGSGVIGLQTARKPNSVLDDHSSTRRITALL